MGALNYHKKSQTQFYGDSDDRYYFEGIREPLTISSADNVETDTVYTVPAGYRFYIRQITCNFGKNAAAPSVSIYIVKGGVTTTLFTGTLNNTTDTVFNCVYDEPFVLDEGTVLYRYYATAAPVLTMLFGILENKTQRNLFRTPRSTDRDDFAV